MKQLFLATILMTSGVWAQPVHLIPSSKSDHSFPAIGPYGRTQVAAREVFADLELPSGRHRKGDILVVFDPLTKRYTWYFAIVSDDEVRAARTAENVSANGLYYLLPDRMVLFTSSGNTLFIADSQKTASSLEDAYDASIKEIQAKLAELEKSTSDEHNPRKIRMRYLDVLGFEFIDPKGSAEFPPTKLAGVAYTDSNWEVAVTSAGGSATIVLDKEYKLVAVKKK